MATNLIEAELRSPEQREPIASGLQVSQVLPGREDPFKFGEQVADAETGRQFGALLDKGKEGIIATANALIKEGSLTQEDLRGLDPNLPIFQSQEGQLAWYQGVNTIIKNKDAARLRAEQQERRVQAALPGATEEERVRSGVERDVTEKELTEITGAIKTEKNEVIFQKLVDAIPPEKLIEMEPAALAGEIIKANPSLTELDAFDDLTKFLNEKQKRASAERAAALKAQERKEKGKKKDVAVAGTIDLLLNLGKAAGASGRVKGVVRKIKGAIGLDERVALLDQFSGALAGNIAKGIGGESGRLTDQDRMFALAALTKVTDEPEERVIKERILGAIRDNLLSDDNASEESRKRLADAVWGGIGELRNVTTGETLPEADIPDNPTDRELELILRSQGVNPTSENIEALRKEALRVKSK